VIELRVPALRERIEDVPELADAVLRRLARRMKCEQPTLAPDALSLLNTYSFPGNVRELENVLERAITLSTGGAVHAGDIQLRASPVPAAGDPRPHRPDLAIIWKILSATRS